MRIAVLTPAELKRMGPVLDEEIECWKRDLFWDFRPSAQLIERFVTSQSLPGFVLQNSSGRTVGYSYYIANNPVGFIGDLYIRRESASLEGYGRLLDRAFESLTAWPMVKRIECQIIPFHGELTGLFERKGFSVRRRFFLSYSLGDELPEIGERNDVRVRPWHRTHFEDAARVVFDSYQDSPDYHLCHDYQSLEGCGRFLRNLIDNPGCGRFQRETSLLALDKRSRVCAVLVTSNISSDTGMIPQVSVKRSWQGRGLGSYLLRRYFHMARRKGLRRVTLSVSAANRGADRLYRRMGFQLHKTFHAYVWQRE